MSKYIPVSIEAEPPESECHKTSNKCRSESDLNSSDLALILLQSVITICLLFKLIYTFILVSFLLFHHQETENHQSLINQSLINQTLISGKLTNQPLINPSLITPPQSLVSSFLPPEVIIESMASKNLPAQNQKTNTIFAQNPQKKLAPKRDTFSLILQFTLSWTSITFGLMSATTSSLIYTNIFVAFFLVTFVLRIVSNSDLFNPASTILDAVILILSFYYLRVLTRRERRESSLL